MVLVVDPIGYFANALNTIRHHVDWVLEHSPTPVPPGRLAVMRISFVLVNPLADRQDRGWSYLEQLAAEAPAIGVIAWAPRSRVSERVRAMRLGADDWIDAGTDAEEVVARIEAIARSRAPRQLIESQSDRFFGSLELRPSHLQGFVRGVSLRLTRRQFEVLYLLVRADGNVLSRPQIYEQICGRTMPPRDRLIDTFVWNIRRKMDAMTETERIVTYHGYGYRIERDEPGSAGGAGRKVELAACSG